MGFGKCLQRLRVLDVPFNLPKSEGWRHDLVAAPAVVKLRFDIYSCNQTLEFTSRATAISPADRTT